MVLFTKPVKIDIIVNRIAQHIV